MNETTAMAETHIWYSKRTQNIIFALGTDALINSNAIIVDGQGDVKKEFVLNSSSFLLPVRELANNQYYILLENGETLTFIKQAI
jgi:hypothetical protein